MQIKISRCHYIPIKMATNWNNNNTKCWWGFGTTGILIHLLMRRQNGTAPLKKIWQVFTQLNILLLYNPAIVLHDIYPKELKTYIHSKACIHVFTVTLSINAKTWNQPSYHLVGEQLIVVQLENGIFFSVTKKWAIKPWKDMEEIYVHIIKWKNPIWKSFTLYACPSFYCMCPFIWQSGKGKSIQKVNKTNKQWFLGIMVGRGINKQSKEDFFRTVKNILYDTT